MRPPRLWVVEIETLARLGSWEPTVGCALTREDARIVLRGWNDSNRFDMFRLAQYERVEPKRRRR